MTRLRRSKCPFCDKWNDLASGVAEKGRYKTEPAITDDDSASFCISCGSVGVFDSSVPGGVRFPTFDEAVSLATQSEILALMKAWAKAVEIGKFRPRPIRHQPIYFAEGTSQ